MLRPSRLRLGALSLASLLAACGGGGQGVVQQPSGGTRVAVQLTAPAAEEVYSATAPLVVSATVTIDGSAAPNGTAVQISAGAASATTTTSSGVASASLAGIAAGRQQVQATVTANGATVNAVRTVYLRPAAQPLRVLVPAYFYPSGSGATAWDALTAGAAAQPGVRITAILNPSDGPAATADANIARAASAFTAAGGQLVGYVYTGYGTGQRSLASIRADIDAYFSLYGRGLVQGIFLDEMAATANRLAFYREIYDYIKAKDSSLLVVGNPGTIPVADYAQVADVLTTFEGQGGTFAGYDPRTTAGDWLYTLPNARQAALVHNVDTCAAMQTAVRAAASARYQAGWVYVTHRPFNPATGVGNPWNGLPTYWTALLGAVDSVNAGRALPACV
ncbi:spherulation-specific family 4 protein [Paracidovorax sp. MALMAid1276]|uniref:spherulation-specific family 4 protein n=1 Tax=Paracidovorax sp. MALMAid1276 TaxID=3411631 RepID=UPI003B9AEE60